MHTGLHCIIVFELICRFCNYFTLQNWSRINYVIISAAMVQHPTPCQGTTKIQARKRNPNPNFLVWISSGRGPKSLLCPSKTTEARLFWRDIPGFLAGCPGGAQKTFETKKARFQFSDRECPRSYRDPRARTHPSCTDPAEPLCPDLIFLPDLDLKSPFSGRNRVEIRFESGPDGGVWVGRCWSGRSGGGVPVAPAESLYFRTLSTAAWQNHRTVMPVATQISLPSACLPPV